MASREMLQFSSVAQSCPTLCDPMNRSTPGLPVHHQLPVSIIVHKQVICIRRFTTNSKQFHEIMKLPIHISADGYWTSNFLYIGFCVCVCVCVCVCQRFFSLLAEALDLGCGQLLDPLVQLLGEYLLIRDVTRLNRLPLLAPPAGTRFPLYLCLYGGCSALALALWLIPLCLATGRCPPPLTLGLTLCSLESPPSFLCHLFV